MATRENAKPSDNLAHSNHCFDQYLGIAYNSSRRADYETALGGCSKDKDQMAENRLPPVRIAVAEDEPDVRKTFVRLLECLGHKVVCAVANGEELLDQCFEEEVDVVFVDLDMPVIDGLAAAEAVSERGIPVILVSGHPDARQVVVEQEPVVARIVKPATVEDLQRAIQQALASRD
jgi:CheY-like chemotaxis protein